MITSEMATANAVCLAHAACAYIAQVMVHLHCHARLGLKFIASLSMPLKAVSGMIQTSHPQSIVTVFCVEYRLLSMPAQLPPNNGGLL